MGIKELLGDYGTSDREVPKIAGKYKGKNLVICGDAACVWDDLERFGCRDDFQRGRVAKENTHFMVVNKLGETFPGNIEHWYSNEPHCVLKYMAARRPEYRREFNTQYETHSCNRGLKYHWPFGGHGTSGLSAVLVGVGLGYDTIMICGIPLDNGPHNGEPPWRGCRFETSEAASPVDGGVNGHWKRAIRFAFEGKVKSMSGRTKEWLG